MPQLSCNPNFSHLSSFSPLTTGQPFVFAHESTHLLILGHTCALCKALPIRKIFLLPWSFKATPKGDYCAAIHFLLVPRKPANPAQEFFFSIS